MRQHSINGLKVSLRGTLLLFIFASMLLTSRVQASPVQAGPASGCPAGRTCSFLPIVTGSSASGDLILSGFEITQAVQDPQNSVPLVEGRTTLLRLFTRVEGEEKPVGNVKINISASTSSQALTGSPSLLSATIPLSYDRASLQSTVNVAIPHEWTHGTVDITVQIDPGKEIQEANEANNNFTQRFVFHPVPPLEIKIVPIRYENPNNNIVYPAPTTESISEWILRTYPVERVNVTFHEPVTFRGNLSTYQGFTTLLQTVSGLKTSEKLNESVVYYGLVPVSNGSSTWFYGGIAGIGWVGSRTSVGLNLQGSAAQIAAHEIGHNFGLWHSPCGGVGADTVEKDYPYPDGSIGQFGMNMSRDNSAQTLINPTTKDIMSYCSSRWISDYVYKKLFTAQSQVRAGAAALLSADNAAQQGLMVRAQITASGAELMPAYVLPGATDVPAAGEYQVEVFGLDGTVIAQVPVQAYTADANLAEQASGINALIPLPDQPAASFRLVKDGVVLAEQLLQSGASPAQNMSNVSEDQPALVRYSRDGGETWETLGIDVSGGELLSRAANPEPGVIYQVIPAGAAQ